MNKAILRSATARNLRNKTLEPILSPFIFEPAPVPPIGGVFGFILVSGTWKKVTAVNIIVSGTWKNVTETQIVRSSNWKGLVE
jgi:hypothetical protein